MLNTLIKNNFIDYYICIYIYTWFGPKLARSVSIKSSKEISSFLSSFFLSFLRTKPGGNACL